MLVANYCTAATNKIKSYRIARFENQSTSIWHGRPRLTSWPAGERAPCAESSRGDYVFTTTDFALPLFDGLRAGGDTRIYSQVSRRSPGDKRKSLDVCPSSKTYFTGGAKIRGDHYRCLPDRKCTGVDAPANIRPESFAPERHLSEYIA